MSNIVFNGKKFKEKSDLQKLLNFIDIQLSKKVTNINKLIKFWRRLMNQSIEISNHNNHIHRLTYDNLPSVEINEQKEKEYYSIKNIMQITGFSRSTVMRALKQGKLLSRKINGLRIIKITDFEKYMEGDE